MNSRLILSFSGSGKFQAFLIGKGTNRKDILKGFERYIEAKVPLMKQKVIKALGGKDENTNPNINQ